ncbi:MAG: helix-turn-helix domain-containing protein [Alphaproteobacteria bacterium]|nr:helix-turn-helix domain-containing protein [Alphaproteobacteria bacterium]
MAISTAQIRGARGILGWSQNDLAERTGISATSIGSIETGNVSPRESTISLIEKAFENAGIEFIGTDGVRLKSGDVKILKGRMGFWDFYEDVYNTVKNEGSEILVSNVDERQFEKWLGDSNVQTHVNRMQELKNVTYKILLQEGDDYFLATSDYAEYRWIKREFFSSVPFYQYGSKLAIMILDAEPTVILLQYPAVASAYRAQFMAMWEMAVPAIPKGKIKATG